MAQRLDEQGNVLSSDEYDAYGNLVTGGDATDPYGYKAQYGYYTDHETGLILCTWRYYDPAAGRWLTEDPIGYKGGNNAYRYCDGRPVGRVDPSGLWSRDLHEGTTAQLARDMGFSAEDAATIGKACADIDNFGVRPPYMPAGDSQSYRFDRDTDPLVDTRLQLAEGMLQEAIGLWNSGKYDEALCKLGQALHPLQDFDAHMNWGNDVPWWAPFNPAHMDNRWTDNIRGGGYFDNPNYDYDPASITNRTYVPVPGHQRYDHTVWCTKKFLQGFLDGTDGMFVPPPVNPGRWVEDFDTNEYVLE